MSAYEIGSGEDWTEDEVKPKKSCCSLNISIWIEQSAPRRHRYMACFGEYDLDVAIGTGASAVNAVLCLVNNNDFQNEIS